MRIFLTIAGFGLLAGPTTAADMKINVEIPHIDVAEYHRPYIAVWIAHPDHSIAANLSVWYQQDSGPEGEGETWLKDIRQWWRRTGRTLDLPVDGVSSPTRAPGQHELAFSDNEIPLINIPQGDYVLNIEATREVGGRELLTIPFSWGQDSEIEQTVSGTSELGSITLKLIP